ncbi:NAD-dependent epimerase/dehydratase family protein [Candidatus Williamhamiltonella defendens]|uniref:Uncharacterized protein n=1 Tax=Candidatus Hamiltonella defensa (Bemisia tabaci) TaxID=672795 RepID=A0A249DYA8_9ENTR|nr:NAD(P)-dependent oxidoreductase [Candidatus Hamiltonella defensa]ASX26339.1 hypothetical protein BA171_04470 [Candidatus Hamiltonella defensa (Bemisia tabaci)]CED79657.1 Putative guanine diphosphate(GDP)-L-fucose 4-epimerase [Candidatus Hamiltonella defensa (Bemisia tabaci)]
MTKIIITGGSGFIGTNIMIRLLELGYSNLLNIDLHPPIIEEHNNYYHKVDLKSIDELTEIFSKFKPSLVIHLAARTDLKGKNIEDYNDNTLALENLCKILSTNSFVERVIFTSTTLVCKAGYIPKSENDYCPTTAYGCSKVEGEKIINKYAAILPSFCLIRPTSIWGPYFKEPYKNFFDMVISEKFIRVGKKSCAKTYGYIGNSVNQILSLLFQKELNHNQKVYYIGDNPPYNIDDWSIQIAALSGAKKPIKVPFFMLKCAAFLGDFLSKLGIKFPLTSFRLNNITTSNIMNCSSAIRNNKWNNIPLDAAILETLSWLKANRNKDE